MMRLRKSVVIAVLLVIAPVFYSDSAFAALTAKTQQKIKVCQKGSKKVRKSNRCRKLLRWYHKYKVSAAKKRKAPQNGSSSSAASPTATATPGAVTTKFPTSVSLPPIPSLELWKSNMLTYGRRNCDYLKARQGTFDEQLNATYYDAQRIFYQIADFTGDHAYWNSCAQAAAAVYRDSYVVPNNGNLPGYWTFTRGSVQEYLRFNSAQAKLAAQLIAENAAFSRDSTKTAETQNANLGRETAYVILNYLDNEDAGQPRRSRLPLVIDHAFSHIDQWFVSRSASYVRPFMVGLNHEALINWYERSGDSRVIPALITATDWMWDHLWRPEARAFQYTDRQTNDPADLKPAPDLNLLIAPAYAWLYRQTGQQRFLDRADQIFAGGVEQAFLNGGKQFDQNYRWSFKYVEWRSAK